jgi:hypothetical protein
VPVAAVGGVTTPADPIIEAEWWVPTPDKPRRKLGFLTIGLFDESDPGRGHESTLEIIGLDDCPDPDRHRHRLGPALGWTAKH